MEYRQMSDVKEGAECRSQVEYHRGIAYSSGSPAQPLVGLDHRLDVSGEMVGVDHKTQVSGELTLNPAREPTLNSANDVPSDIASTESSNFEFASAQGIPQLQQYGPSAFSSVSGCCPSFSPGLITPSVLTTSHVQHSMPLIAKPDVPNHLASKSSQTERSERGTRDYLDPFSSPSTGQVYPAHSDKSHQISKLPVQSGKSFHHASSSVSVVWCHEAVAEANRNLLQCAEHPQVSTCHKDSHFQGSLPCTSSIGGQIEKEHGSFLPELQKMSSKMKMPRYDFHPYGEPKVNKECSSDESYVRNQWKSSNTSQMNVNVSSNQSSCERKEYRSSPEPECQLNEQQCQNTNENQYFEELHDAIRRSSWNENLTALVLGNQRLLSQIARERGKGVFSNTSTQVYPGLKSNEQNYIASTQSLTDTSCLLVKPVGHTSVGQAQLSPCLTPHGDTLGPVTRSDENHNYSLVNMNSLHFTGQPPQLHENIIFPQLTKASPPLFQVPMAIAPPLGPFVPVRSLAPIQNYNLVNQLSPFFDNRHRPLMGLQCPTYEFPAPSECPSDEAMLQSMFSRAIQPKPSPLGFPLDNTTAVQVSQRMSYQAPLVSPGYQVTPYPDVYNMFRAANLLSPYHTNPPANSVDKTSSVDAAVDASKAPDILEGISQEDDIDITDDVTSEKDFRIARHRSRAKAPRKRQSHECSMCQKTYSRASALKIHMRLHTGEKPYICDICNRSFAQAGGLESHRRSHTGERPFRCDVCGRNFSHSTAVRNHMRTHTGEKPYACDLGCGKRFADQSTLKKHRRIHTGEKPFSCPQCGRMFSQLGNMNKHVRCRHDEKAES